MAETVLENRLRQMTLRQKIGQLVCMRAYAYKDKLDVMLQEGVVGALGAVMFRRDCHSIEDAVRIVNGFYRNARLPLMLYMDAEEGITDFFDFGTSFPTLMALGATFSEELSYKMGYVIGVEAKSIGFAMVGNPVLDINTNPDNPIVGTRAFGDRPDLVVRLGAAYVKGMQEAGVLPLGKHFPGHGDTHEDSHVALPRIDHNKARIMEVEAKPYAELIRSGMEGIMTAHIVYASLLQPDEEPLPVTLSDTVITGFLRGELGFGGVIVSDSLAMKGIKDIYGEEQCAVLAIKAGHDIILQDYGSDPEITIETVRRAVEAGQLPERRIDEAVIRIWETKARLHIADHRMLRAEEIEQVVGSEEHLRVAREIADRSVTLLENTAMPFPAGVDAKLLIIATANEEEGTILEDLHTGVRSKAAFLYRAVKQYQAQAEILIIAENPDAEQIALVKALCPEYRYILYATFPRIVSYKQGSGSVPASQAEVIHYLNESGQQVAFLVFGNPYFLRNLPRLQNCLCMYGDCVHSIEAGLKVLFGRLKAQGKLPVAINERYSFGYGVEA